MTEPAEVSVPVELASAAPAPFTTDLGYEIELDDLRVAASGMHFTVGGEEHLGGGERERAGGGRPDREPAYHPGHAVGGEIMGELREPFVIDLARGGDPLGEATLLAADYDGADLALQSLPESAEEVRAEGFEGVGGGDPLLGYGAVVAGTAARDGQVWTFEARVELEGAELRGIRMDVEVTESGPAAIALEVAPATDEVTILDGIAFAALDEDGGGAIPIRPGTGSHDALARNLARHELYGVSPAGAGEGDLLRTVRAAP